MIAALALLVSTADAAELVWDGFYRGRGLVYDSLSLSEDNPLAEGTSNFYDHRLLLQPTWRVSDHAAIKAEMDLFRLTPWGESADVYTDPVTGDLIASAAADGVGHAAEDFGALRAWGEGYTEIGGYPFRFAMGRMPMQWGTGILWNDGSDPLSEYGDTADRIQVTGMFNGVYVFGAWDTQYEGYIGDVDDQADDIHAASLAVGYRNETVGIGLLNNFRFQPSYAYKAYTADLWGFAALGPLDVNLEFAGVFGGGDLDTGANDIQIVSFGGLLEGSFQKDKLGLGGEFGFATGDEDTSDDKITTFSFDRDHNVAMMLFEETLPTLEAQVPAATNGGRETGAAVTGDGVSNAVYFRPSVRYRFVPSWEGELSWVTATRGKSENGGGYGNEFDLSLRVDPHPHLWATGTFGLLLPGKAYTTFEDEDLGGDFNHYAVGLRLVGTVEF